MCVCVNRYAVGWGNTHVFSFISFFCSLSLYLSAEVMKSSVSR